jgi:hypothetical protein
MCRPLLDDVDVIDRLAERRAITAQVLHRQRDGIGACSLIRKLA